MVELSDITEAIRRRSVRVTLHADEETQADNLTTEEVFSSALHGEIIEDYPTDRPFPSCLIYGRNVKGEPIHSVWAYNGQSRWAVLVTVYRPDPNLWIEYRERRRDP